MEEKNIEAVCDTKRARAFLRYYLKGATKEMNTKIGLSSKKQYII